MPGVMHDAVSAQASIKSRLESDGTIISVSGELDLASADQLEGAIWDAEQSETRLVVIDLEDVTFLDSAAFHVLLKARKRARENGNRLRFVPSGHDQVTRVVSLTDTSELLFS